MTDKLDYISIRNWFIQEWANYTPIAEENLSFDPPNDRSPFIELRVEPTESETISLGVNFTRRQSGQVMVTAYCPVNSGPGDMVDIGDRVKNIFLNLGLSPNIVFKGITEQRVGKYKEGFTAKTFFIRFDSFRHYNP